MSTTYPVAADAVRTTVASYSQGSGEIAIGSASGFPTPSSSAPILFTAISAATYGTYPETFCTYQATGLSGTTLTGLTVIDGMDAAWSAGDIVEMRTCAQHLNGPATAVQSSILTVNAESSLPNSKQFTLTTTGSSGAATFSDGALNIPEYSGGGGSPGGSSGQIQYNESGSFGGAANLTVGASGQINHGPIAAPGGPAAGDLWFDATQQCHTFFGGSTTAADCLPTYRSGLIFAQTTPQTQATPNNAEMIATDGAIGTTSLPAGFLNVLGRTLRVKGGGYYSTGSTGGAYLFFKLGSNIIATTAIQSWGTTKTNAPWAYNMDLTVCATGSSGQFNAVGALLNTNGVVTYLISNGTSSTTQSPQTPITLDLTQSYSVGVYIYSITAGNTFTQTNCTIEVIA